MEKHGQVRRVWLLLPHVDPARVNLVMGFQDGGYRRSPSSNRKAMISTCSTATVIFGGRHIETGLKQKKIPVAVHIIAEKHTNFFPKSNLQRF